MPKPISYEPVEVQLLVLEQRKRRLQYIAFAGAFCIAVAVIVLVFFGEKSMKRLESAWRYRSISRTEVTAAIAPMFGNEATMVRVVDAVISRGRGDEGPDEFVEARLRIDSPFVEEFMASMVARWKTIPGITVERNDRPQADWPTGLPEWQVAAYQDAQSVLIESVYGGFGCILVYSAVTGEAYMVWSGSTKCFQHYRTPTTAPSTRNTSDRNTTGQRHRNRFTDLAWYDAVERS